MRAEASRSLHIELTDNQEFSRRIVRLAWVSVVALGIIWFLARRTIPSQSLVHVELAAGWILMPSILALSLSRPRLRYALIVPSLLVTLALLTISLVVPPGSVIQRVGWALMTGGVLLGGSLGVWFWFRWLPVPSFLVDPFSRMRWGLIGLHVCLIVIGIALVGLSASGLAR